MKFKVLLHKEVESVLGRLDASIRKRIAERLRELEDFPVTKLDTVKIAGEEDTFRLCIGKYRALFKIYQKESIIVVAKLDLRKSLPTLRDHWALENLTIASLGQGEFSELLSAA